MNEGERADLRPPFSFEPVTAWICVTCGVQQPPSPAPPPACPICDDFRQFVGPDGQQWAHLAEIASSHEPDVRRLEEGLTGLGLVPSFGIGQRALLAWTPAGNLLWDCVPMTPALAASVRDLGGISAIASSHPHFYSTLADWSREFGAPAWLPAADAEWRMRADFEIVEWQDQAEPLPGVQLVQVGGHFEGSAVLHWTNGEESEGVLCTGDSIQVVSDRRWVSFMRSYPNQIPLPAHEVVRIADLVAQFRFARLYGGWWERTILADADAAVQRSVERYLRAISEGV